ncbi:MAG: hypothetical protein BWY71_02232 [Planctomycetes bacterium ADurb.Bin412]|nr:MAG: hypothetical protein BWY71_02232 [Planctomycetes bacterium ADurb.Bin412]
MDQIDINSILDINTAAGSRRDIIDHDVVEDIQPVPVGRFEFQDIRTIYPKSCDTAAVCGTSQVSLN